MASGASTVSMTVEVDPDRAKWGNKFEFILSVVSYAVGLGNIWRFSYLCERDGGGAFLIPYLIMAVFEGLPIFYIEFLIGQSVRKGAIGVWRKMNPRITGIGYASAVVSFVVAIYYNVLITWCLWYFARTFWYKLPWRECEKVDCAGIGLNSTGQAFSYPSRVYDDEAWEVQKACANPPEITSDYTSISFINATLSNYTWQADVEECARSSRTQYFFYRTTLDLTGDISTMGGFNLKMFISLTAAWLIVGLCLVKGIQSTGKIVYFTAIFPYIVLITFFIRAIFLPGFYHGIIYLFKPDFVKLQDPSIWLDAAGQIFFSFSLAMGGLIAFASYNPPSYNCKRDVVAVTICNCVTGLFAASIIFAILGNKAYEVFSPCVNRQFENEFQILIQDQQYLNEQKTFLGVDETDLNKIYVYRYKDFFGNMLNQMNASNYTYLNSNFKFNVNFTQKNFTAVSPNSTIMGHFCDMEGDLKKSGGGTGLAFIAFTEAIMKFPFPPIWSLLFFLMLLSLGLGTEFGLLVGVLACVDDVFDIKKGESKWYKKKWFISSIICFTCYLIGLLFVFGNGYYYVDVFDTFGASFPLLLVALFECIAVLFYSGAWFSNAKWKEIVTAGYKQMEYWNDLIYHKPLEWIWTITWCVAPVILVVVFLATIIKTIFSPFQYRAYNINSGQLEWINYPWWIVPVALGLCGASMFFVPFFFFKYSFVKYKGRDVPYLGRYDVVVIANDPAHQHDIREITSGLELNKMDIEDESNKLDSPATPMIKSNGSAFKEGEGLMEERSDPFGSDTINISIQQPSYTSSVRFRTNSSGPDSQTPESLENSK